MRKKYIITHAKGEYVLIKIGISGCPSTGKTTLARSLCNKLKGSYREKNIELVSEYARIYLSKHGPMEYIWEQKRIMEKQIEWEDSIEDKIDILVTDSPVHIGFLYAVDIEKRSEKDKMIFNDIFKKLSSLSTPTPRYDFIFHLPLSIDPEKDNVREKKHLEGSWRQDSENLIKATFKIFPPKNFVCLESVDLTERVDECMRHMNDYLSDES